MVAMSASGQKQTCAAQKIKSALPPKADMCGALAHVRYVPIADISFAATRQHRGSSISYFLKRLTTATATITATTTSAQISSFEIVSRPQPIICVSPYSITSSALNNIDGGTVRPRSGRLVLSHLEFNRHLNGQVTRFGAAKYLINIGGTATNYVFWPV